MASDTAGRIEVGKGSIPYGAIGIAVAVLAIVLLGFAYASMTPFGAEIGAPTDLEAAVNEHFAKNEKRFPARKSYYNCAGFIGAMFGGKQEVAVAVEQAAWRPGVTPDNSTGNLVILNASRENDGPWQISSKPIAGATYDPSSLPVDSPNHPCNLR